MSEKIIPLDKGKFYHIYNRGNNYEDLFKEIENYTYFLNLVDKYISPIAEMFAWVLMKNHFHFLVYIKKDEEINEEKLTYTTVEKPKKIDASKQFSNLFNAYTQAINKRYNRKGSLFEKNFERKLVSNEKYLNQLIYYIHHNPVKHHFVSDPIDYPWSSFLGVISSKPTKIQREKILQIFHSKEEFLNFHKSEINLNSIEDLIID